MDVTFYNTINYTIPTYTTTQTSLVLYADEEAAVAGQLAFGEVVLTFGDTILTFGE